MPFFLFSLVSYNLKKQVNNLYTFKIIQDSFFIAT